MVEHIECKNGKPICPHCHRPIEHLENVQDAIIIWDMDKNGEYSDIPRIDGGGEEINYWACPHCGEEICDNEEEAIDFLNCTQLSGEEKAERWNEHRLHNDWERREELGHW